MHLNTCSNKCASIHLFYSIYVWNWLKIISGKQYWWQSTEINSEQSIYTDDICLTNTYWNFMPTKKGSEVSFRYNSTFFLCALQLSTKLHGNSLGILHALATFHRWRIFSSAFITQCTHSIISTREYTPRTVRQLSQYSTRFLHLVSQCRAKDKISHIAEVAMDK